MWRLFSSRQRPQLAALNGSAFNGSIRAGGRQAMGCLLAKNQTKPAPDADHVGLVTKSSPRSTDQELPAKQGNAMRSEESPGKISPLHAPDAVPGSPSALKGDKRVHYSSVEHQTPIECPDCESAPADTAPGAVDLLPATSTVGTAAIREPPLTLPQLDPQRHDMSSAEAEAEVEADLLDGDQFYDDGPVVTGEFADDFDFGAATPFSCRSRASSISRASPMPFAAPRPDETGRDSDPARPRREVSISQLEMDVDSDDEVDDAAPRFSFSAN